MKTIAHWSRNNKVAARILIGVCHILIVCSACYAGIGLSNLHVYLPPALFWICLSLFGLIIFLISKSYSTFSFNKKKCFDSLILTCSFIMILTFANQKNLSSVTMYKSLNGSFAEPSAKAAGKVSEPSARASEKIARPTMKELKRQLKELRKMAKDDKATAGGVVLAIIVGVGLALLLAAASCSLACNDQGTLALFVFAAGLVGIFFICRLIIKSIKKKNREKPSAPAKPVTTSA